MNRDAFGITHFLSDEVCTLLYRNPDLDVNNLLIDDVDEYNESVRKTYSEFEFLKEYKQSLQSISEFDLANQENWFMPDEYKTLDIAEWVLHQCKGEAELQRAAEELMLFQDRELFPLLQYCKYLVDTFRKNNIVWGLGRGSSVASFVLYKIGIHKINSLHYRLNIQEFLK